MPGREHLAATPHLTDQRLDGWLAQAPRRIADVRPGALSRRPAPSLLISASRAGSPRPLDGRRCKDGAAHAPPRTALLIKGSKPDPRWV
jgi:hypothetical protein